MKPITDLFGFGEVDNEVIKGIEEGNIKVVLSHRSLMTMVHDGNQRLLSFLCTSDNLIRILTVATSTKEQFMRNNDPSKMDEARKREYDAIIEIYNDERATAGVRSLIEAAPSKFCIEAATDKKVLKWAHEGERRAGCISKLALKRGVVDTATEKFAREIFYKGGYGISNIPDSETLNSICEHIAEHHYSYSGYNTIKINGASPDEGDKDSRDPESVKLLIRSFFSRHYSGKTTPEWLVDVAKGDSSQNNVAEAFNSLSLMLLSTHKQLEFATLYSAWIRPWDDFKYANNTTNCNVNEEQMDKDILKTDEENEPEEDREGEGGKGTKTEINNKIDDHEVNEYENDSFETMDEHEKNKYALKQFPLTKESIRFAIISARLIATRWSVADENVEEYVARKELELQKLLNIEKNSSEIINKEANTNNNNNNNNDTENMANTTTSGILKNDDNNHKDKEGTRRVDPMEPISPSSPKLQTSLSMTDDVANSQSIEKTDNVDEPSVDEYNVHTCGQEDEDMGEDMKLILKEEEIPYQDVLQSVPVITPLDAGLALQHIIEWFSSFFTSNRAENLQMKLLLPLVAGIMEMVGIPYKTVEFNRINKITPAGSGNANVSNTTTGGIGGYGNNSVDFFLSTYGTMSSHTPQMSPEALLIQLKPSQSISPTLEYEEEDMKQHELTQRKLLKQIGLDEIEILLNSSIPTSNGSQIGNMAGTSNANSNSGNTADSKSPAFSASTDSFAMTVNAIPSTNGNNILSTNIPGYNTIYKMPPASPIRILAGFQKNGVIESLINLIFGSPENPVPIRRQNCSILQTSFIRILACYIEFAGVISESNTVITSTLNAIKRFMDNNNEALEKKNEQVINNSVLGLTSICKSIIRLIILTAAGEYSADEIVQSISTLSDIGHYNPLLMSSSGKSGIVGSEVGGAVWSGSGTFITIFKTKGNGVFENNSIENAEREAFERRRKTSMISPNTSSNVLSTPKIGQLDSSSTQFRRSGKSLNSTDSVTASTLSTSMINSSSQNSVLLYSGVADTTFGLLLEKYQKKQKNNSQRVGSSANTSLTFSALGNSLGGRGGMPLNINVDISQSVSTGTLNNYRTPMAGQPTCISTVAMLGIISDFNNNYTNSDMNLKSDDMKEDIAIENPDDSNNPEIGASSQTTTEDKKFKNTIPFDSLLVSLLGEDEGKGCRFDSNIVTVNTKQKEAEELSRAFKRDKSSPLSPFEGQVSRSNVKRHKRNDANLDDSEDSDSSSEDYSSSLDGSDSDGFSPVGRVDSSDSSSNKEPSSDDDDKKEEDDDDDDEGNINYARHKPIDPISNPNAKSSRGNKRDGDDNLQSSLKTNWNPDENFEDSSKDEEEEDKQEKTSKITNITTNHPVKYMATGVSLDGASNDDLFEDNNNQADADDWGNDWSTNAFNNADFGDTNFGDANGFVNFSSPNGDFSFENANAFTPDNPQDKIE